MIKFKLEDLVHLSLLVIFNLLTPYYHHFLQLLFDLEEDFLFILRFLDFPVQFRQSICLKISILLFYKNMILDCFLFINI